MKHLCLYLCLTMMLAACAPQIQAFRAAEEPPAVGEDRIHIGDGEELPMRVWMPSSGPVKAVIVAVHGFNDYSNAFASPGRYFARHGVALYAYDQRGFGATQGRGIWAGEENLVHDLRQMVRAVRAAQPGIPIYVLGESMGGAVVMIAASSPDFPPVDGVILSAPAVWGSRTMNVFYRTALWTAAHTIPWKQLSGRGLKIIASDNFAMLRELSKDPLIIKETRVDAIYGIAQLMDTAYDAAPMLATPTLLLYGRNDQVIPSQPIFEVAERLNAPYKLAYYPAGFHMLLRDLKAEVVMDDILAWVAKPRDALPSGYDLNWRGVVYGEE